MTISQFETLRQRALRTNFRQRFCSVSQRLDSLDTRFVQV